MRSYVFVALAAAVFALGISSVVYSIQKCGVKTTFLLGDRAPIAAMTGMCDKINEVLE